MEFLFWILVVLLVITLLGHGIWVAIATLLRALHGGLRDVATCPVCRAAELRPADLRCLRLVLARHTPGRAGAHQLDGCSAARGIATFSMKTRCVTRAMR